MPILTLVPDESPQEPQNALAERADRVRLAKVLAKATRKDRYRITSMLGDCVLVPVPWLASVAASNAERRKRNKKHPIPSRSWAGFRLGCYLAGHVIKGPCYVGKMTAREGTKDWQGIGGWKGQKEKLSWGLKWLGSLPEPYRVIQIERHEEDHGQVRSEWTIPYPRTEAEVWSMEFIPVPKSAIMDATLTDLDIVILATLHLQAEAELRGTIMYELDTTNSSDADPREDAVIPLHWMLLDRPGAYRKCLAGTTPKEFSGALQRLHTAGYIYRTHPSIQHGRICLTPGRIYTPVD